MRTLPDWLPDRRRALGARIAHLRYHAGLTQQQVIDTTGIPHRTYQRIEAGTSDPRYSDLLRIADAIGVPPLEVFRE